MNKVKVSVVVAAYNEEKHITKCLNSLVNQTFYKYMEIIVVDDGSIDNTWKICKEYAKKYDNVHVYHEANKGQGLAREYGLHYAHGEYIGFTDADDWDQKEMFEEMYNFAHKNKNDIVVCDVHKIYAEKNYETSLHSLPESSNNISIGKYIKEGLNNAYLHNKLFVSTIWKKYHFKNMVYEDLDLVLTIISYAKKIGYIQKPFYNYYKHANSTTSSYTNPRLFDIFKAYQDVMKDINPKYFDEAGYQVATRILRNMNTPGFIYYKADFVELINKLKYAFIHNPEIYNDNKNKSILYYLDRKTVPNVIISNNDIDKSWIKMGNSPAIYIEENIGDELNYLYNHGGLLIKGNWTITSPYDYLRYKDCVIWKDNCNYVLSCRPYSLLISKLLKSIKSKNYSDIALRNLIFKNDNNLLSDFQLIDLKNISSMIQIQNKN